MSEPGANRFSSTTLQFTLGLTSTTRLPLCAPFLFNPAPQSVSLFAVYYRRDVTLPLVFQSIWFNTNSKRDSFPPLGEGGEERVVRGIVTLYSYGECNDK